MATKAKTKAKSKTKPTTKHVRGPGGRHAAARASKVAEPEIDGAAAAGEPGAEGSTQDPRIPPLGTIIKKLDRHGRLRCECKVVENGFEYRGAVYPSLSAAAMVAAKDLKLTNKTQNGFAFWRLERPADLLVTLAQAWRRYEAKAAALVKRVTDENRVTVAGALGHHLQTLERIVEKISG